MTRDGLPTGTVTFLFTDIEGSTRLLHELGDGYADVLAEHRRLLREAFGANGGVEVDTQGDAFFYAFARPGDALAAADAAQRALEGGPVRVRTGVHTGTPNLTEEGYVGVDVHRAARVMAVAHGGQVVVSESTASLVDRRPLRDLGEHRLKDLGAPIRLYQLGDAEFPPLRSLNATNLPVAATPFAGRADELARIHALLRDGVRLVTLTGPGGSGKTRLALHAAAECADEFAGGVFFVGLAGVGEPELVASTIRRTLGIHDFGELRGRQTLLVLDNWEHVLEAAPTAAEILAAANEATVVATSRAPLRVQGEYELAVEPLPEADAVDLFVDRARAVRSDFEVDADTVEICRRLEGLPLALELAAPRLRSLSARALLDRLDRRLPVLTGGRRDAPERQRTLRATIEWSVDLLDDASRATFARLGVFAGTFSLEAAEAVARATFDDVDALVEASLLKRAAGDRFLMLETIRELARELLEASGEADALGLRHAEFLTGVAESASLVQEAEGPMRHDLVVPERDNIRAALAWAVATGRAEAGLRLACALENYWVTADPAEGDHWVAALLDLDGDLPPLLHAHALRSRGNCVLRQGDVALGERLYAASLEAYRRHGDRRSIGIGLHRLAAALMYGADSARAQALLDESLAVHRELGFKKGEAGALGLSAELARREGDPQRALELAGRSAALAAETGFSWWEQNQRLTRARLLFDAGRPRDAAAEAQAGLAIARRIGDRSAAVDALLHLARAALVDGDEALAGRLVGAVEADLDRAPIVAEHEDRAAVAELVARAGPELEDARARGRDLTLDAAADLIRGPDA